MNINKLHRIFFVLLLNTSGFYAQNLDSLWMVYNDLSQDDTNRLKAIDRVGFSLQRSNPDSAIKIASLQLNFAQKVNQKKYQGWAYLGLGNAYFNQDNYSKALHFYLKSLKICEELKDQKGLAYTYNNIGLLHNSQLNPKKALSYFNKSLQIRQKLNDKLGQASCFKNMGIAYNNLNDFTRAIEFYELAIKLYTEFNDEFGLASCYNNIGNVLLKQLKCKEAIEYFYKPLKNKNSTIDKKTKTACYINLGICYNILGDYNKSLQYTEMALELSKEIDSIDKMRFAYQGLADLYAKTNNYKKAYLNHVEFKKLTDSIFNIENSKQFNDLKNNFEIEKKAAELKLKTDAENEKLKAIALEEKKQQQIIIYGITIVLLIVVIFSFFLYNRFKITNKQNIIIEQKNKETEVQKKLIEEKHEEILASIRYAKRIQDAILTPQTYIERNIKRLRKS